MELFCGVIRILPLTLWGLPHNPYIQGLPSVSLDTHEPKWLLNVADVGVSLGYISTGRQNRYRCFIHL